MKTKKSHFVTGLCTGICLIAIALFAQAEETMQNPGFEDGETGWYNWNVGQSSGEISGTHTHSGAWAAQRDIYGKGMGCFGQILPVLPGEMVSCRAWVFNPKKEKLSAGAEVYLRIEFWNDKDEPLKAGHMDSRHLAAATNDWTLLKVQATAPPETAQARILAYNLGRGETAKGTAYFDDFEVTIN